VKKVLQTRGLLWGSLLVIYPVASNVQEKKRLGKNPSDPHVVEHRGVFQEYLMNAYFQDALYHVVDEGGSFAGMDKQLKKDDVNEINMAWGARSRRLGGISSPSGKDYGCRSRSSYLAFL
jgi:hypothetical protein